MAKKAPTKKAPRKSPGNRAGKPRAKRGKQAKDTTDAIDLASLPMKEPGHSPSEPVKLSQLSGEARNHRKGINDAAVRRMAESMGALGQLQPIGITPSLGKKGGEFAIVWGFHRVAAARLLGWDHIQAVYVPPGSIERMRAAENEHRVNLTAADRAATVARLAREIAPLCPTIEAQIAEVSSRLGWDRGTVRQWLALAGLPDAALEQLEAGNLTVKAAMAMARMDPKTAEDLAKTFARAPKHERDRMADQVFRAVRGRSAALVGIAWDPAAEFAGKPACIGCPYNTDGQAALFGGVFTEGETLAMMGPNARCMNPSCFAAKGKASQKAIEAGVGRAVATLKKRKPNTGPVALTVNGLEQAGVAIPPMVKPGSFIRSLQRGLGKPVGQALEEAAVKGAKKLKGESKPTLTPEQVQERELLHQIEGLIEATIDASEKDPAMAGAFMLTRQTRITEDTPELVANRIVGLYQTGPDLPKPWGQALADGVKHASPWDREDWVRESADLRFAGKGSNIPRVKFHTAELAWWRHLIQRLNNSGAKIPVPPAVEEASDE